MVAPSSSLKKEATPTRRTRSTRLALLDDATQATNPKEKKKIQNRVAQRSYRNRMKARIQELQDKLDVYEANETNQTNHGPKREIFSPTCASDFPETTLEKHQDPFYKDIGTYKPDYLQQSATLITSPAQDTIVVASDDAAQHGALEDNSISVDSDMTTDINIEELPDLTFATTATSPSDILDSLNLDFLDSLHILAKGHDNTMPEAYFTQEIAVSASGCCDEPYLGTSQDQHSDLESRIEAVLKCAEGQGFENFDSLISDYYSKSFRPSSSLDHEQWLSRNRRLPGVLAAIAASSKNWSFQEKKYSNDEFMKATEGILSSEVRDAGEKLGGTIDHLTATTELLQQELLTARKHLMSTTPGLWALLGVLVSTNRNMAQRNRSDLVLAISTTICFAGKLPKDRLLQIWDACL